MLVELIEAAEAGAIFHPFLNWNLSLAHSQDDIDRAVAAAGAGLAAIPPATGQPPTQESGRRDR